MRSSFFNALLLAAIVCSPFAQAQLDPPTDQRFCGPPERYADGTIKRSAAVLREFELNHPRSRLPTVLDVDGYPEPWYRDHGIPLACCGCDSVENLQWLPESQWRAKSRWERIVYGGRGCSPGCP